ncbi:MAG: hypothetical protein PVJ67_03065 [Candidatus Pacearchaeota archaeon]
MADKKVRIDEHLLNEIKKFREKKKINKIKYPSDKHFIHLAVLSLLEKEDKK